MAGCDGTAIQSPQPAPSTQVEAPRLPAPTADKPSRDNAAGPREMPARGTAGIPPYVLEVLAAIQQRNGEPLPGYVGGRFFQNRERRLPRGHYREYDVHPKVRGINRGPERIVIEQDSGRAYYSPDHYRSFTPLNGSP